MSVEMPTNLDMAKRCLAELTDEERSEVLLYAYNITSDKSKLKAAIRELEILIASLQEQ